MEPQSTAGAATTARRGRADQAIYEAVCELLAESGYERLTMDAVAARAQTSKATLYRHWTGKPDLVAHAVKCRFKGEDPRPPDTGSLRGDLLALLDGFRERVRSTDGDLYLGILTAMRQDPELARIMHRRSADTRDHAATCILQRARDRGDALRAAGGELPISAAMSELATRCMMRGEPADDRILERLVDEVVLPALSAHGS
ncbi:hypothetical protein BIV57_21765 [Mangrovactinospora gilvigrisea]|uniref:HTH tetR-type domain-containing protein n=1 Tax=Mangrovactinospora gilvigrisea TaxID=1428644 RepID=A0A1J7B9Z7_9ACTN|nr:TetR/AcrR family transcriptional regulator [Mangrovactinospora gilvigrisea]OIV35421.1 hypothetical protein BIV57_21765 [Mangrovactinospora gilvigrisea]